MAWPGLAGRQDREDGDDDDLPLTVNHVPALHARPGGVRPIRTRPCLAEFHYRGWTSMRDVHGRRDEDVDTGRGSLSSISAMITRCLARC